MIARRFTPLMVALALAGVYSLSWLQAQGLPPAPGGFLETATSTVVRPTYTAQQIQALLPNRGTFTFPAPYNTTGIRLTNASDCGGGDCVDYVGYWYWRNMNNSAGSNYLYAFVGLNRGRGGAGPSLFRYDKTTGETVNLGPILNAGDPMSTSSAEGWYFSATQPAMLYMQNSAELRRVDVLTHASSTVFNITTQLGGDKSIFQIHSSNDDRVHSFTLLQAPDYIELGCATYREDTHQFNFFPTYGNFDECQIDKSGHWLLIKEDVDGIGGEDNRIINLDTGAETVLLDADGAGGHSDNGFGSMLAADNTNALPNAVRLWTFGPGPLVPGPVVYRDPQWDPQSMHHLSFANARSAPFGQQYACGSAVNRTTGPRANEIVCFRLDGSLATLVVAPVMTDLNAGGGTDDYSKAPKGNLDPTGQYFIWTSNMADGRLDAFIVRVPAQLLVTVDPAADTTAPTVSVTAPTQAATVIGDVTLSASAADNVGVAGVQFKLDSVNLGAEILTPPFAWTWHTTTATDGVHALTAVARDAAGNVTISPSVAVTVLNTPAAPLISGLGVTSVTSTSAVFSWTTNQLADSWIEYGSTNTYGSATTLDPALVSAHLRTVDGLAAGTTYHYRVTSKNAQGIAATSADFTFTTVPFFLISNVATSGITSSSAVVSWDTSVSSSTQVEYGLTGAYGSVTALAPALVTAHSRSLVGLVHSSTYHYRVRSIDGLGRLVTSGDMTFVTPAGVYVSNVVVSNIQGASAAINWITDQPADTQIEYGLTTAYGGLTTLNAALVTGHGQAVNAGLVPGTTYHFRVRSKNAAGLLGTSVDATFTTAPASVISAVVAAVVAGATATITWTTDLPTNSKIEYGLTSSYGSSTTLDPALVTSHSHTITGLTPGTPYFYLVRSITAQNALTKLGGFTFTTATPPIISNVQSTGVADTAATINWLTNRLADSLVEYGPTTAYGAVTALNPALVNTHNQSLTGLTPGTLYHFRVKSSDNVGTLAISPDATFTTLPTPVISAVSTSALTGTSALITWTTNLPSNSRVEFGLTSAYGSVTAVDLTLVTAHSQAVTGLTPGTTYFYRVRSVTAQSVSVELGGFTFTTVGPPVISSVTASTTTDTATVTWSTDVASDSQVAYGLTTTYGSTTALVPALVTTHNQTVTGLTPGTLYHYRVQSRNNAGVLATSGDGTFTTAAGVVVSNVVISNIQGASVVVNWITDQPTDTQIEYGLTTAYGSMTTLNAALVTGHGQAVNSGLVPGTTYHLRVRSRNASGQLGVSNDQTVTTAPAPVISAVGVASVSGTSATISWTTDLAANSKIEYGLTSSYGSSTTLDPALVTSHSHTITGLSAGTTYYYLVRSITAQNALAKVGGFTVTTSSAPVISTVASSGITSATATITWTTNQPADSLVEYGTTTAYGATTNDTTLVTSHSQGLSGLTAGTLYHFRVKSANASTQTTFSGDFTFTTAGPFALSAINASAITGSAATISWSTDQPSSSVIEYGTTTAYGSTWSDPAMVTSHSRNLSGLANGTTYHYRVSSTNGVGQTSTSADLTFTTVGAPVISAVSPSALTPTDATISWTTDQASSTRIEYGPTTAYGAFTTLDASLVTSHSQNLSGLSIATLYHYRVHSQNAVGIVAISGDFTFTTVGPPFVSTNIGGSLSGTSITFQWTTSQPATSQIEYGPTTAFGSVSPLDSTLVTSHQQTLTGLTSGATYFYRFRGTNSFGLTGFSQHSVFSMPALPFISGIAASGITEVAATISWATDQRTDARTEYGLTTAYGSSTALDPALNYSHAQTLTGLAPAATYHYRVLSANDEGLLGTSADRVFTTATPNAPAISAVSASAITGTSATMSWSTDLDSSTQIEYGTTTAYGSLTTLDAALVTSHSQSLIGLAPGTLYHYRVRSVSALGAPGVSGDLTFTTVSPPVILQLSSTLWGATMTFHWTTDQPATTQIEYGPTSALGTSTLDPALVTGHQQALTGLTPGTTYFYRVRATNTFALTTETNISSFSLVPLPLIQNIATSGITATAATISWSTDQPTDMQIEYGLTTAYGTTTPVNPALSLGHAETLVGLQTSTTYHYRIHARNGDGLESVSTDGSFTTLGAPVISGLSATGATATSATIAWTTDQPANSLVEYGPTTAYGSITTLDSAFVTAHSQSLAGLSTGTLYHYHVISSNSFGLTTTSADGTFTTSAGVAISNVVISNIQGASAAINWVTDQPADTQIEYGLTTAYGSLTSLNTALAIGHGQAVNTGLVPGTTYHFRVRSRNAAGLLGTSADATFTTAPAAVISNMAVASVTGSTATITWTTDLPTNSRIEYGLTASYGLSTTLDPALVTSHSHTIAGLSQGTTYFYLIRATTAQNALTKLGGFTVTTGAPPVISSVGSSGITTTSATITWTTNQAADSQVEYGPTTAYGSTATNPALVSAHSTSLTGLTPGATYHYRVKSTNSAAFTTTSADFTFTATDVPVLPPYVSGVVASTIVGGSATISWTTAQLADSQIEYGPTTAYGSTTALDPAMTTAHSQTLTGLAPGTIYHFRVRSQNGAGLQTSPDGVVSPPAPIITNVTISNIQGASAAINWTTDQPADTQIEYGLTTAYTSLTTLNSALAIGHGQAVNAGLVPGTAYHFRIRARNAAGVLGTSADMTFTTAPAAVISAVAVASVTSTSATITWTTNLPANSKIEFGLTGSYGSSTTLDPVLVTAHSHTIAGLAPGTTYYFLVRSITGQNALTKVGGFTVTTAAATGGQ